MRYILCLSLCLLSSVANADEYDIKAALSASKIKAAKLQTKRSQDCGCGEVCDCLVCNCVRKVAPAVTAPVVVEKRYDWGGPYKGFMEVEEGRYRKWGDGYILIQQQPQLMQQQSSMQQQPFMQSFARPSASC